MFAKSIATKGGDVFRDEKSLAFDGSNDYVETSFVSDYISTNATIAFWVKMNDFSGQQTMGIHNSKRWYHGFKDANIFIGVANAHNESSLITPSPALVAGQWIHYCLTAIDGTATVYINGVAQGTMSYAQSSATDPDSGYFIGARDNGGAGLFMNCNISEVVHYNVGLTINQVKTIYNGREPYNHKEGVASGNLQAWYRMGDGNVDFFSGSGNGLVSNVVNNTLGTDLNSTANATSISNESNGTAGGWINGDGLSNNQCSVYEASTDNAVSGTYTLHATCNDNNDRVYYSFSTTSGKTYLINVSIKITNHHTSNANLRVKCGNAQNGSDHFDLASYVLNPTTDMFDYKLAFTASASTTFFTLRENGGSNNVDFYIDALSIKQIGDNAGIMVNLGNNFEGDTP